MIDYEAVVRAVDAARRHEHPFRAMRVTLECAHLRLMPWNGTVMGIGAFTSCGVCPESPERVVVNVEETGVLHESAMKRFDSHDHEETSSE